MKHNLLKSVIISVILLMGVSNAWGEQNLYEVWMQYTFNGNSNSYTYYKSDNNSSQSLDLGTLTSDFIITDCYWKCYADWKPTTTVGYLWYQLNTGNGVTKSKSVSNAGNGSYQVGGSSLGWKVASKTDPSGKYTMKHNFYAYFNYSGGHNDWTMNNSGNNYKYTYTVLPPSVNGFTVTPSGNKLSGSGKQNDPYIIKHNGSLTLTLSGSQNHTDANSTIQYNTAGTWNTTNSRTISNITSTDVKNVTVEARYKNNSDANLCGAESSQTIYYRSEQVYTVTFNANGHGTAPAAQTVSQGSKVTKPADLTATGYTFGGWYKESNCTNAFDFNTAINADITLFAKWTANTYTVTLNPQLGTGGTTSVTATYGSAMPTITKPTRTGYTFNGYYDAASSGTQYYKADGSSAKTWNKTAATTLYAQWTANQYAITYRDQNNANFSGSHASGYPTKHTYGTATTLKDATKTGYTFGGWHTDQACTNKVTSLGATAYTAAITLYAKWTINQYTLDFGAGEGGSVVAKVKGEAIKSPATLEHGTSVTLTATPTADNIFIQWVNESETMVSTANPYTFNLTENKTVKAEFAPPTTVYLKPEGYWPDASARFAIIASAAGKQNKQVNMQTLGCENEYYSANVPVGYTTYKYVRVNPSNTSQIWNETGVYNVQDGKNKLHVATRIYFKPDVNWKSDNARFAVYFYKSTNNSEHLWRDLTAIGDDYYVCNSPGTAYDRAIFCRMDPSNKANEWETKWNQTNDLYIDINSIGGKNLYTITKANGTNMEGDLGIWSTHWETFTTPTYPLTLKATPYGEYTVKCNGVSHTSSRTKDIIINLPVGATVEITTAESYDAAYNSDLVIKTSSNSQYEAADLNTTYTFCGATTIEENFTTTADHVVFLRVATDDAEWNTQGDNYIYCTNRLTDKVILMEAVAADDNSEINQETGYNYFKATVPADPAGYRAFRFERKTESNVTATNTTEYFEHLLPLGQSNCFTIKGKNIEKNIFYGDWALGTAEGDYRILYVEQQVAHGTAENDWKTVINTTYQHASDIIKKGDGATIVSLHIKYDKTKHPEVILQKFTDGEWVDVEGQAHMVLGPLTASADMAMLPGRRNTEGDVNLRYGDGIEKIKDDAENGKAGRVWNFVVQQSESGASAHIDFNTNDFAPYPYTRNYYIRTDNAAGGWMTYAIPGNVMSHSEYSLEHSGYSHYFCKWVALDGTPNVKFVVANDYGAAISDTIASDIYTDEDGTLEADANVRWMWNEYTNEGSRAYIAGSEEQDFLTATYTNHTPKKFTDMGEWVYEINLNEVHVGDALTAITANYAGKTPQQLMEETYRENGLIMLASAENDARVSFYTVRIVYDFKINQTICYLIPTGTAVTTSIDVLIERINQDEEGNATQVTAAINSPANTEGLTVYGLITLTKDHITKSAKSEQEALTYWISFPFNVKIGDITGFGEVGKHWMIKYYDGAERAEKGWFLDTKTFWKFFLDTEDVMLANTGYVLTLNKSLLNASNPVYDNTETLRLYFPSEAKIKEINSGLTTEKVDVPEHWCNITSPADRTTKDSHWNMIGVPSYANKTISTTNTTVKYFYDYSHKDDKYNTAQNAGDKTFKPMHAYMVQFAGVIDWENREVNAAQQHLAAKKNADAEEQYTLRLELQQNGTKADQTFVELHDDATTMFDMNVDLTKMFNTGANIYTLIGSDNQVAANVMPIANTVIPVGVQIAKAGEYTFAMPDGTDGITVELIDYETNTRTNLLLSEYTVNLTAGTCENRFALSVKPNNTTTSLDNISGEASMKKFIIDGVLYMQKDGVLYDAQGHVVR